MADCKWSEARDRAHALISPRGATVVPLRDAMGERLFANVRALIPRPSFDTSAMDGYAVAGRAPWRVAEGSLIAGDTWAVGLSDGDAVEIATGAPVPLGTTRVMPYEVCARSGDLVSSPAEGRTNIRRIGEEFDTGDVLAAGGMVVTPALLGLAASGGVDALPVIRRPVVEAVLTGSELVHAGVPRPPKIRDAIGPMLDGFVTALGGTLSVTSRASDEGGVLEEAIRGSEADVVLVAGSTSHGRKDLLHRALRTLGACMVVDGVSCRPGHPQLLAQLPDGHPVVGLPGNPLAAVIAMFTLLQPLVLGLTGTPLPSLPVAASRGITSPDVLSIVPVRWRQGFVTPVERQGSAMLYGLSRADALAVVRPGNDQSVELMTLPMR